MSDRITSFTSTVVRDRATLDRVVLPSVLPLLGFLADDGSVYLPSPSYTGYTHGLHKSRVVALRYRMGRVRGAAVSGRLVAITIFTTIYSAVLLSHPSEPILEQKPL